MPPYKIEFTKRAGKEFDRLPKGVRDRVIKALYMLAQDPFSELLKIKKLKGASHLYRLRFGDYRVVYEIRQNILVIVVVKIGHRRDVYRFL